MESFITQSFIILLTSYIASRATQMIVFGMSYKSLLGGIKMYLALRAKRIFVLKNLVSIKHQQLSEQREAIEGLYDYIENESFLLRLLGCSFCLGIWISIIASLIIVLCFSTSLWSLLLVPIFTFHITELS